MNDNMCENVKLWWRCKFIMNDNYCSQNVKLWWIWRWDEYSCDEEKCYNEDIGVELKMWNCYETMKLWWKQKSCDEDVILWGCEIVMRMWYFQPERWQISSLPHCTESAIA